MDSIYILIPIALIFTAIAIKAFLWAIDNDQYDDLDAAAHSILFDEDPESTDKTAAHKPSDSDSNSG